MKHTKFFVLLGAGILLVGILGCIWVMKPKDGNVVEILQDGTVLYCMDLSETEDQSFEITSEAGTNVITIQDHSIRVSSADCADQTCVHMGSLSDNGLPIVCLPHKLVIQYKTATVDGATR